MSSHSKICAAVDLAAEAGQTGRTNHLVLFVHGINNIAKPTYGVTNMPYITINRLVGRGSVENVQVTPVAFAMSAYETDIAIVDSTITDSDNGGGLWDNKPISGLPKFLFEGNNISHLYNLEKPKLHDLISSWSFNDMPSPDDVIKPKLNFTGACRGCTPSPIVISIDPHLPDIGYPVRWNSGEVYPAGGDIEFRLSYGTNSPWNHSDDPSYAFCTDEELSKNGNILLTDANGIGISGHPDVEWSRVREDISCEVYSHERSTYNSVTKPSISIIYYQYIRLTPCCNIFVTCLQ